MNTARTMSLMQLRDEARAVGCELVTKELLDDMSRMSARLSQAEAKLRDVAALRLVSERQDWRGRLARRWISRTQSAVDMLRGGGRMCG